ncbi:MAG: ATP-binding protein [Thermomicrobiales bacterium]
MTEEEFVLEIESGLERRHIEYKGPGSINDKQLVGKIARAVLAMTNRQDGGYVIVGVGDANGTLDPIGFDLKAIESWTRDALADKLAPLADPSVDFDLEHQAYNGRFFVVILVREFDESPVFCRANRQSSSSHDMILREGALYVRGRRKPETIEIRTSQEMRDLLDLALTKRLRRYVEQSQAAGVGLGVLPPAVSSSAKFRDQLSDLGI